jgi:Flp pilus assembly pilin Flp
MMRRKTRGQGLVEYLILTCLIAVSGIWVVSTVGKNIAEQYANVSRALTRGDGQTIQRTEVDEASFEGRGMDDFMRGARKSGDGGAR